MNNATNAYKEEIKVGFNQHRKIVLLIVWGAAPLALFFFPTLFGIFALPVDRIDFVRHVGSIWLAIGIGGGLFRMIQSIHHQGCADRSGVGPEGSYRPVSQHRALLQVAARADIRGELIDASIGTVHWHEDEAMKKPHLI